MQSAAKCLDCTLLFETFNNSFIKVRGVWIANDFLKFVYQISIEFRFENLDALVFFQIDMMFSINS